MSTSPQAPVANSNLPGLSLRERVRKATKQIESEIILETLEQHRWNRRRTAAALKISYRLLMYKMKGSNLRGEPAAQQTAENGMTEAPKL